MGTNGAAGTGKVRGKNEGRGTKAAACRCGQQLDCCTRQHCPRCGRSIHSS